MKRKDAKKLIRERRLLEKRLTAFIYSVIITIEKYWFFRDEDYIRMDPADYFLTSFMPRNWEEVWTALRLIRMLILTLTLLAIINFYFKLW